MKRFFRKLKKLLGIGKSGTCMYCGGPVYLMKYQSLIAFFFMCDCCKRRTHAFKSKLQAYCSATTNLMKPSKATRKLYE